MRRSAIPLLLLPLLILAGCRGKPGRLAPPDGPLQPCPSTPNCVSTEATDALHGMPALPFTGSAQEAQTRARSALLVEPRTRIVTERPGYLHAEARSRLWRFVDDVEVLVDADARVVRFRSASRLGRKDFGVNRARMERFGERFRASADSAPVRP
jgi:uncharacterized protein (DUF1499 family)